jgi:hypothetical protein
MPYNPGVVDQSGQLFAQGMSKGLESLAEGFEKMREAKQRVIDNGKIADSFVKNESRRCWSRWARARRISSLMSTTGQDRWRFRAL